MKSNRAIKRRRGWHERDKEEGETEWIRIRRNSKKRRGGCLEGAGEEEGEGGREGVERLEGVNGVLKCKIYDPDKSGLLCTPGSGVTSAFLFMFVADT